MKLTKNIVAVLIFVICIGIGYLVYEKQPEIIDTINANSDTEIKFPDNLVENPFDNPPTLLEEDYLMFADDEKISNVFITEGFPSIPTYGFEQDNVVIFTLKDLFAITEMETLRNTEQEVSYIYAHVDVLTCLQGDCPSKDVYSSIFATGNDLNGSTFKEHLQEGYVYVGAYDSSDETIFEYYLVDPDTMTFYYYWDSIDGSESNYIKIEDFLKEDV